MSGKTPPSPLPPIHPATRRPTLAPSMSAYTAGGTFPESTGTSLNRRRQDQRPCRSSATPGGATQQRRSGICATRPAYWVVSWASFGDARSERTGRVFGLELTGTRRRTAWVRVAAVEPVRYADGGVVAGVNDRYPRR